MSWLELLCWAFPVGGLVVWTAAVIQMRKAR